MILHEVISSSNSTRFCVRHPDIKCAQEKAMEMSFPIETLKNIWNVTVLKSSQKTLAGWVRNLTKITSNGFPEAVGDGFWPSWGGLLGHLSVQRPPGQKQTPKVWKLAAPWGTQRNPKMTVFLWKHIKIRKNSSVNECCKKYYFLKDFVSILMPFVRAWRWKKQWKLCNCMQI